MELKKVVKYKFNVYLTAIKEVEALTEQQWMDNQVSNQDGYVSKDVWISYLKDCALDEVSKVA